MAKYRKVDPRLWDDERFVDFDDLKRSLWLLLLTGPAVEPIPGLQIGGIASLAETLRRPVEPLRERLGELLGERLVEVDERLRLIRLPNALKYNEPDNPNQIIGWFRAWQSMPESRLKYDHIESIREACELADIRKNDGKTSFILNFNKTFGTVRGTVTPTVTPTVGGSRVSARARSEQEQEQEQEQDTLSSTTVDDAASTGDAPKKPRRKKSQQAKLSLPVKYEQSFGWELWRPIYKKATGKTYPSIKGSGDGNNMKHLVDSAVSMAEEYSRENGMPLLPNMVEEVLRYWFESYLADDGRNGFLKDEGHKLRFLMREVGAYGSPFDEEPDPTHSEPIYPIDPPGTVYTDAPAEFWDAINEIGRL